MRLLIDECTDPPIAHVFERHNHELLYVRRELGRRTDDPVVAKYANEQRAIVVTWNVKDFAKLMRQRARDGSLVFPHMGLIGLQGKPLEMPARIESFMSAIKTEYEYSQSVGGRLNIQLTFDQLKIVR